MAQTKRKRRRKHRGTQAGNVERPARTRQAQAGKGDARKAARERRLERLDRPPTWRGALNRAAIAALLFGVLVVVVFGRPAAAGAVLAVFMLVIYIPMSFYTDLFIYRRRQRRKPQHQR